VTCVTAAPQGPRQNAPMSHRTPISKAELHETLCRELEHVRAPECTTCKPPMPRRLGPTHEWACVLPPCAWKCDRKLDFLTRLFSQRYRLRDLCDTIG